VGAGLATKAPILAVQINIPQVAPEITLNGFRRLLKTP